MATHPKTRGPSQSVKLARQLFLFGNGDGKPVTRTETLCKLAGIHPNTLKPYIAEWEREREEIVATAPGPVSNLCLSAVEQDLHKSDMKHLRDQIQQVKYESDKLDSLIEKFEEILTKFDSEHQEQALKIFDRLLDASMNKQNLRNQFLKLQSQWTKLSGVEGLMDVGLTRAKEDAKLKAKLDARKEEAASGVRDVTPEGLSVFKRGE